MPKKVIYQTVADRGNPDYVLKNGPFKCKRNTWLGEGYYFWDTSEDLAHWWGDKGYHGKYMVTRTECEYFPEDVFDLMGNMEHLQLFKDWSIILIDYLGRDDVTVNDVLNFVRRKLDFPYKAIRAVGKNSIRYSEYPKLRKEIRFAQYLPAVLDLLPPAQICFFEKEDIHQTSRSIVYPRYTIDYSI